MPSTISSSDKSKVKSSLPSSSNKILTATVARVFVAYPNQSIWSYTGIEGALAFVRDSDRNTFALKLVDLKVAKGGVIWEHELYEPLSYNQDRTHFHTLEGDEHMIGFAFADDGEAGELYKKISNRQKFAKSSSSSAAKKKNRGSKLLGGGGSSKSNGGKIDKSMIGAPSDFKHVAHMGYTAEKGFSAENVDPSWSALLDQLSNMGISRADIQKNEGFIKDFVGKRGGVPPKPAARQPAGASKIKKVPPPAPSRAGTTARKQPPPPPAPRTRPGAAAAAAPASASIPAPPPPPPPARGGASAVVPPPPPPPARGGASAAAPPPPPPPPPARGSAGGAPPPPPPPPAGGSNAPPPPPPPGRGPALPAPQSGRADLLASIQGQGVHNLRKVDPTAAAAGGAAIGGAAGLAAAAGASGASGTPDEGSGGDSGADLASALAAALSQRKENMGDSDEEAESDEEW